MERKTAEETMREVFKSQGFEHLIDTFRKGYPNAYPATIQAMQSYADQEKEAEAVAFAEWIRDNALLVSINFYKLNSQLQTDRKIYSVTELYEKFTNR